MSDPTDNPLTPPLAAELAASAFATSACAGASVLSSQGQADLRRLILSACCERSGVCNNMLAAM